MDPWPKRIDAITLFVEDLAATRQFYQDVFGLPIHYEDDNSAVFNFGETVINLLTISEAVSSSRPAVVAPRRPARAWCSRSASTTSTPCARCSPTRGVELLNGPMDRPWGIRTASFVDPAGHIWEIAK